MCGIVGYWSRNEAGRWREDLPAALDRLRHRGPDDRGVWTGETGVGLGHVRLSILDLTDAGHQPMTSADGRRVLVYNGEIYNFRAVRTELEKLGKTFRGSGDTEVVLAALETWGLAAVHRFIGMFAFAYWDEDAQRLWLVRDRLGVKPLYYGWQQGTLWFGSELKALRAFGAWRPQIDPDALAEYFKYQYIAAPRSIYRDVYKLPPGHCLELRPEVQPQVLRYWSVLDALDTPLQGDDQAIEDELEALMRDAFSLRMVADVPVGVFLSGGLDSSLVTALLQDGRERPLHTFTIGFEEGPYDESGWARRVADHLGTEHTARRLSVTAARDLLPLWADLYDEPFGDSSGVPTLLVSRLAAEQVKVVLSADGGDELFAGYSHYAQIRERHAAMHRVPAAVRSVAAGALAGLDRGGVGRLLQVLLPGQRLVPRRRALEASVGKLRRVLPAMEMARLHDVAMCYWQPGEVAALLGRPVADDAEAAGFPGNALQQMCLWDFHRYLPEDILTKVDRATMATSIEGREPLLDHRLAEFAFRLPDRLRQGALGSKHILRRILYRHVPRRLLERPKQGFAIPLADWLRGDLGELVDRYLDPARIRAAGILDPALVAKRVHSFRAGCDADRDHVWSLLAFEMWREKWG